MKILSRATGDHALLELDSSSAQTVKGSVYFDYAYFNQVPFVDEGDVFVQLATLNSLSLTPEYKDGTLVATLKWGLIEHKLYVPASQSVDLSGYYTSSQVDDLLTGYLTSSALTDYLPKTGGTLTGDLYLGSSKGLYLQGGELVGLSASGSTRKWSITNAGEASFSSLTIGGNSLATVATSGSYNDLTNTPTIPSLTGYATQSWVTSQGYTKNTGTLTGVNMNGESKGSSGVVDLGIVSTQEKLFFKNDYEWYVVLLCKKGIGTTNKGHRLTGKLYTQYAGYRRYQAADIDFWYSNWSSGENINICLDTYGLGTLWSVVSVTYGGVEYYALQFKNTHAIDAYFLGTSSNILFTPILYYVSNTATVKDSEIYNSIKEVSYNSRNVKGGLTLPTISAPSDSDLTLSSGECIILDGEVQLGSTHGYGFTDGVATLESLSLDTALPIASGGTGATTAAAARSNLGLGAAATYAVATSITSTGTGLTTSQAVYDALGMYYTTSQVDSMLGSYATQSYVKDLTSRVSYTIPAVSTKRWIRVAKMTTTRSCGTIAIAHNYNNAPNQSAVFHVQAGYTGSSGVMSDFNITQIACTCRAAANQQDFTKVRIVYQQPSVSSAFVCYVEVFCNFITQEGIKVSLSGCNDMELITSATDGSIPTGYASREIHLQPGGARNECYQLVDLSASTYNVNTFYPVVGSKLSAAGGFTRIEVRNNLNSDLENVPSWSTHTQGFTANMVVYTRGSEYGINPGQTFCVDYQYSFADKQPVGYTQMGNASYPVLWLRGGGKYNVYTDRLMAWSVKTATFTDSSQSVAPQSGGVAPFTFNKARLYAGDGSFSSLSVSGDIIGSGWSVEGGIAYFGELNAASLYSEGALEVNGFSDFNNTVNFNEAELFGINDSEEVWMIDTDGTANFGRVNMTTESTANGYGLCYRGDTVLRAAGVNTVVSTPNSTGSIYFRPLGTHQTSMQAVLGNDGTLSVKSLTQTSDETKKYVLSYVTSLTVEQIANAPVVTFTWKDEDNTTPHLGTLAQYWKFYAPECVHGVEGENMSMEYGTLGMVSSIVAAREVVALKEEIKELKKRLEELESSE